MAPEYVRVSLLPAQRVSTATAATELARPESGIEITQTPSAAPPEPPEPPVVLEAAPPVEVTRADDKLPTDPKPMTQRSEAEDTRKPEPEPKPEPKPTPQVTGVKSAAASVDVSRKAARKSTPAKTETTPAREIAPDVQPKVAGNESSSVPDADEAAVEAATSTPASPPSTRAAPNYRRSPQPEYPAMARKRRQQGEVLLLIRVNAAGQPESVTLKKSSGFESLDIAAMDAVKHWEFIPAREHGVAVASTIEVPIRFALVN